MIAFDPSSPIYLDFLCRALDGDLLHAQFEGEDFAGRGPIVFLRDESGSMHGLRRATACALQLALMVEARKEGRRFVSIPFSDVGQFQVYDPGHKPDPQALVAHLDTTYGGGTEPYGPLAQGHRAHPQRSVPPRRRHPVHHRWRLRPAAQGTSSSSCRRRERIQGSSSSRS